jgi:hypothetical protein
MKDRHNNRTHAKVPVVFHEFAAVIPQGLAVLYNWRSFPCIALWMQDKRGTLSFTLDGESIARLHDVHARTGRTRSEVITAAILVAGFSNFNRVSDLTSKLPVPACRNLPFGARVFEGGWVDKERRRKWAVAGWPYSDDATTCRVYGVDVPEGKWCDTPCDLVTVDPIRHELPSWCPLRSREAQE